MDRVANLELAGQLDARNFQLAVVVAHGPDRMLGHVYLLSLWRTSSIAAPISPVALLMPLPGLDPIVRRAIAAGRQNWATTSVRLPMSC